MDVPIILSYSITYHDMQVPFPSKHGLGFHEPHSQIPIDSRDFHLRPSQKWRLGSPNGRSAACSIWTSDTEYDTVKHQIFASILISRGVCQGGQEHQWQIQMAITILIMIRF